MWLPALTKHGVEQIKAYKLTFNGSTEGDPAIAD